jgi:hypothetical protein
MARPIGFAAGFGISLLSYSRTPEYLVGGTLRQIPVWIKFQCTCIAVFVRPIVAYRPSRDSLSNWSVGVPEYWSSGF